MFYERYVPRYPENQDHVNRGHYTEAVEKVL